MARKRTAAETMYSNTYVESNPKSKRTMIAQEDQCQDQFFFKLPKQQQQQELGSFWISFLQPADTNQAQRQPTCEHQRAWAEDRGGISLSLSLAPCRPCAGADDSDMQDTASSGGLSRSSDSSQRVLRAAPACAPAQGAPAAPAAAAGEDEDSMTSGQSSVPAAACARPTALFALGSAGPADFDVSSLYCWEVLHNVLDGL